MNETIIFINNMVFNLGALLLYFNLFKDQFKYKPAVVITVWCVLILLDILISPHDFDVFIIIVLIEVLGSIFKVVLYKSNVANCFTLDYLSIAVMNMFGNGAIVGVSVVTGLLSGGSINWADTSEMSISMSILINVSVLLGSWLSYKLCKVIKDEILGLKGFLKYSFMLFMVVPQIIVGVLKGSFFSEYAFYPEGVIFVVEVVTMTSAIVGCIIVIFKTIMRKRKQNDTIVNEIYKYEGIKEEYKLLRETLGELNHDVNNYISSKGTSYKETIENYCDKILNRLED